ncbi:MAG TPA: hypothetical protein VGF04_07255 [Solirubrobacterales bacterium]
MTPGETCAVCDRTILAGERTRTYISPKLGPRGVCDLCRDRASTLGWVDPAAPGANVGRRVAPEVEESPTGRLQRAADRFSSSGAARTVSGLMRTLGRPSVSIGAAAGSSGEARVTVAWELCWYQWSVGLDDDEPGVAELDRGSELNQLDNAARQWNASADEDGRLLLGTLGARPSRDGEPVG